MIGKLLCHFGKHDLKEVKAFKTEIVSSDDFAKHIAWTSQHTGAVCTRCDKRALMLFNPALASPGEKQAAYDWLNRKEPPVAPPSGPAKLRVVK